MKRLDCPDPTNESEDRLAGNDTFCEMDNLF
jgi:hypothetical protein